MRSSKLSLKPIFPYLLATFFRRGCRSQPAGVRRGSGRLRPLGLPAKVQFCPRVSGTGDSVAAAARAHTGMGRGAGGTDHGVRRCAGATVLLNGEPGRVLAPSIVLAMCVLAGLLHDGARTVGSVQEEARP